MTILQQQPAMTPEGLSGDVNAMAEKLQANFLCGCHVTQALRKFWLLERELLNGEDCRVNRVCMLGMGAEGMISSKGTGVG